VTWAEEQRRCSRGRCIMVSRVLACCLVMSANVRGATAGQRETTDVQSRPSMASLRASFRRASRPVPAELTRGTWVEITNIMTEAFVTGRSGPEHVLFDRDGIKRPEQQEFSFEWTVRFSATPRGLLATFESVGTPRGNRPDTAAAHFNSRGDLVFAKDNGGEGDWTYRCRAMNRGRLVCLLRSHENGHGVEFMRTSGL
jgi:hypothetical protein